MKHLKVKINGTIVGYSVGQVISIVADDNETPFDEFWRRRLKDAEIDNCCEIVKPKSVTRNKTIKKGE